MARNVRTARGETVDFDALILKHQLAQAPMNVDVERRREFIDNKEGRARPKPIEDVKVFAPKIEPKVEAKVETPLIDESKAEEIKDDPKDVRKKK